MIGVSYGARDKAVCGKDFENEPVQNEIDRSKNNTYDQEKQLASTTAAAIR